MNEQVGVALLRGILRPIVRFFVRRAIPYQLFAQLTKSLYVELGTEELRGVTKKINPSRIAAITGINRLEVKRLLKHQPTVEEIPNLHAKIVSMWAESKRFRKSSGEPRPLSWRGKESEFAKLVRAVSAHVEPGTTLFELERVGLVERQESQVILKKSVDDLSIKPDKAFQLFAREIATLAALIEENTGLGGGTKHLHIHTEYDNIRSSAVPQIKAWILDLGRDFHRKVREYLAQFDLDITPATDGEHEPAAKVEVVAFGYSSGPGLNGDGSDRGSQDR